MASRSLHPMLAVAIVALASIGLFGCGSDEKSPIAPGPGPQPAPTTSDFTGVFIGQGVGGMVIVTFDHPGLAPRIDSDRGRGTASPAPTPVTIGATALLSVTGGNAVTLLGSYSEVMNRAFLTGAGGYVLELFWGYSLETKSTVLAGTLTGPVSGTVTCYNSKADSVRVYAGTFQNAGQTAGGTWNFATVDTFVFGVAWPDSESAGGFPFTGSIAADGDSRAIVVHDLSSEVTLNGSGALEVGTGAVAGTWTFEDASVPVTDSGTWSGALVP